MMKFLVGGTVAELEPIFARLRDALARLVDRIAGATVELPKLGGPFAKEAQLELSRSIALLSENGDGVVLSILVSREEILFFTKEIRGGVGSEQLSPEEDSAVSRAMGR